MPVPRGGSAPVLLSAAKTIFYQCGFAQLPRHRALQAQTSHLQLNMLAKLNQKIFLENYLLHRGNHLLGLNDSRPKKSHQPNTSQYKSRCFLLVPIHSVLSINVLQTTPAAHIPPLSCTWFGCWESVQFPLSQSSLLLQGATSEDHREAAGRTGGHAVKWSGLQVGLSTSGLSHYFLCQGVKLKKIWSGKSRALCSTKERNSCRVPGTANVNGAPLAFIQLKG